MVHRYSDDEPSLGRSIEREDPAYNVRSEVGSTSFKLID